MELASCPSALVVLLCNSPLAMPGTALANASWHRMLAAFARRLEMLFVWLGILIINHGIPWNNGFTDLPF